MNFGIILYIIGFVVKIEAACMIIPWAVALFYGEKSGWIFLVCAVVFGAMGHLCTRKKPKDTSFYAREGFLVVALSWIVMSIIGAIPFVVSGEIKSVTDALFEIVSGFTTTGASILEDVEAMSHGMLFWRSFSHWIGGMGILVFLLAILPMAGGQDIYLMRAESTGPSVGKLVPKVQKTAMFLYSSYFVMTVIQLALLIIGRMPLFDALCVTFGTAGTGGFGVLRDSIASYSPYCQAVITIFMLLFGINFNFYFLLYTKNFRQAFKMEEVKCYFAIYFAASAIIFINLLATGTEFGGPLEVLFQTSSVMTSTGFATADFNLWPELSRAVLVIIMFTGACAGSTGGGMKVSRFIIYVKSVGKEIGHLVHPRSVKVLKTDGRPIEHDTIRIVNVYMCAYILIFAASLLLILIDNFDLVTSFTAVAAAFNNIGPGLGIVGPAGNFAAFSPLSKYVLIFDMLAGRLEIFPMLLLFFPRAWKRN